MLCKIGAEYAHKASQNDKLNALFVQQGRKRRLKGLLAAAVFSGDNGGRDSRRLRSFQSEGPGIAGNHKADVPAFYDAAFLRVDQGLKIGAAAGDQDGNFCLQHMRTLSSL